MTRSVYPAGTVTSGECPHSTAQVPPGASPDPRVWHILEVIQCITPRHINTLQHWPFITHMSYSCDLYGIRAAIWRSNKILLHDLFIRPENLQETVWGGWGGFKLSLFFYVF